MDISHLLNLIATSDTLSHSILFFFFNQIYLFIFICVGSSLLRAGFP